MAHHRPRKVRVGNGQGSIRRIDNGIAWNLPETLGGSGFGKGQKQVSIEITAKGIDVRNIPVRKNFGTLDTAISALDAVEDVAQIQSDIMLRGIKKLLPIL